MPRHTEALGLVLAIAVMGCQGCSTQSPTAAEAGGRSAGEPTAADDAVLNLQFDPTNFVAVIDHPFNPLAPGTTFHYRSETPDGVETNDVVVTYDTKQILGVTARVVHDLVFLDGELQEETFDWFAQDAQGNVWYLGEDSKEFENGQVASTEGSWEAGVGEGVAGIIMLAHPKTGVAYRQEFAPDVAEDKARVLSLKTSVEVPYGRFEDCLQTMEWTRLEPGVRAHKFYCRGVGFVLEVEPRGGRIRGELVGIDHF